MNIRLARKVRNIAPAAALLAGLVTSFAGGSAQAAAIAGAGAVLVAAPPPSTECADICAAAAACNTACTVSLHTTSTQNGVTTDAVTEVQNQTCGGFGKCSLIPAMAAARVAPGCENLAPWADGLVHFNRVFNRADSFGGDRFGGGYTADGRIESNATSIDRNRSTFLAHAQASAWGRVFGWQQELAYGIGDVYTPYGSNLGGYQAEVRLAGVTVYRATKNLGPSSANPTYNREIFNRSLPFQVGPATVTVSGAARIAAGLNYRFDWGLIANQVNLSATPSFVATGQATASVGAGINLGIITSRVEAGVTGNLTLVQIRIPAVANVTLSNVSGAYRLDWSWNVPLELTALAGKIDVFVRGLAGVCVPFVGCAEAEVARYTRTIARFDGLNYTSVLGSGAGCVNLPANANQAVVVAPVVVAAQP